MSDAQKSQGSSPPDGHDNFMKPNDLETMGNSSSKHNHSFSQIIIDGRVNQDADGIDLPTAKRQEKTTVQAPHETLSDDHKTFIYDRLSAKYKRAVDVEGHMKTLIEGPSFERICDVTFNIEGKQRKKALPACFDMKGGLRAPWQHVYKEKIADLRKSQEFQLANEEGILEEDPHTSQAATGADPRQPISVTSTPTEGLTRKREYSKQTKNDILKSVGMPKLLPANSANGIITEGPGSQKSPILSLNASPSPDPISTTSRPLQRKPASQPKRVLKLTYNKSLTSIPETPDRSFASSSDQMTSTPNPIEDSENQDAGRYKEATPLICRTCHMTECLCSRDTHHLATIVCSGQTCPRGQFDAASLQRLYQIRIEDAQKQLKNYRFWFCPDCKNNLENRRTDLGSAGTHKIQRAPEHGENWLDHEAEICRPLDEISGILSQYMAAASIKPQNSRFPVSKLPCIYSESSSNDLLVVVLRQLLDVHRGVSILKKVESLGIEPAKSVWMKGALMLLIKQFLFDSGSPFEDTSKLRDTLSYMGLSSDMINTIVQDTRIRAMEESKDLRARQKSQLDTFVAQLNEAMFSLVGNDTEINELHVSIAEIISAMNIQMNAHCRGRYAPIYPKTNEPFVAKYHTLDNPELEGPGLDPQELEGKPILWTIVVGVKYQAPGRDDWIVCSLAKVRLIRPAQELQSGIANENLILPQNKRKAELISVGDD